MAVPGTGSWLCQDCLPAAGRDEPRAGVCFLSIEIWRLHSFREGDRHCHVGTSGGAGGSCWGWSRPGLAGRWLNLPQSPRRWYAAPAGRQPRARPYRPRRRRCRRSSGPRHRASGARRGGRPRRCLTPRPCREPPALPGRGGALRDSELPPASIGMRGWGPVPEPPRWGWGVRPVRGGAQGPRVRSAPRHPPPWCGRWARPWLKAVGTLNGLEGCGVPGLRCSRVRAASGGRAGCSVAGELSPTQPSASMYH